MKRDILNSPRLLEIKKRRQKIFLRKSLIVGFLLVIVFFVFTYVAGVDKLNISQIEIVGNKITDTEMIKGAAQEELSGKYFWLFPKTNLFLYPKKAVKNKLSENFKRLENIDISIKENNVLEVSVTERKAVYVWCGEVPQTGTEEIQTEENCYFMDDSGFIFDQAPYFSGNVYFKFYGLAHRSTAEGQVSENENPIGSYFGDLGFAKLVTLKEILENIAVDPVALYKLENGDLKIYLSSKSSKPLGPEIILKMDSDFEKMVENLQSALSTEPLLTDFKKKYSSLLYLDLRFGNKVYFKFK